MESVMTNSHIIKAEEWFQELRNNLIANANIDYSDLSSAINKEIENKKIEIEGPFSQNFKKYV